MALQDSADGLEINDLLTRCATAVDTKDWDLFAACFTPDAYIDDTSAGGIKGTLSEAQQRLARVLVAFPMTQHLVTNRGGGHRG